MLVKIWILNNSHRAGGNGQYIVGHTSQEYPVLPRDKSPNVNWQRYFEQLKKKKKKGHLL